MLRDHAPCHASRSCSVIVAVVIHVPALVGGKPLSSVTSTRGLCGIIGGKRAQNQARPAESGQNVESGQK
jgi:hypothetical protein